MHMPRVKPKPPLQWPLLSLLHLLPCCVGDSIRNKRAFIRKRNGRNDVTLCFQQFDCTKARNVTFCHDQNELWTTCHVHAWERGDVVFETVHESESTVLETKKTTQVCHDVWFGNIARYGKYDFKILISDEQNYGWCRNLWFIALRKRKKKRRKGVFWEISHRQTIQHFLRKQTFFPPNKVVCSFTSFSIQAKKWWALCFVCFVSSSSYFLMWIFCG